MKFLLCTLLFAGFVAAGEAPKFEIADVHPTPPFFNANGNLEQMDGGLMHGGRYELRRATMIDLIQTAYGISADKIVGGPNWVEMNRYDIIAKTPADATSANAKLMLRSLLAERFALVVHNDKKPLPAFALTAGKTQ